MKKWICLCLCLVALMTLVSCDGGANTPPKTYTFRYENLDIAIDADAAPIVSALDGKLLAFAQSPSCAFSGLDKVYTYANFEIQTYPMGDKDYVYMIQLLNDLVQTPEGIRVGSTKEDVISVYGEASEESANALTYRGDSMRLEILLKADGTVNKIRYWRED